MATKTKSKSDPIVEAMESLGNCLTPDSARRMLKLKASPKLRARADLLADKCSEGTLTPEEREEYRSYINFSTIVAYLKSRSRLLLAKSRSQS